MKKGIVTGRFFHSCHEAFSEGKSMSANSGLCVLEMQQSLSLFGSNNFLVLLSLIRRGRKQMEEKSQ